MVGAVVPLTYELIEKGWIESPCGDPPRLKRPFHQVVSLR